MKISQIQSYQPVKVKQNNDAKKQNNTTPAFKGVTLRVGSLPRVFSPLFKAGVLMLTVLGMSSCIRSDYDKGAREDLRSEVFGNATNYESEEGSNISEQEMEYYNDAIAYYEQIENEKVSGSQLKILSYWIGFYTNLKSEEGMKLTAKEKEQIRVAVYNKIYPKEILEPSNIGNNLKEETYQRQFILHDFLYNNR